MNKVILMGRLTRDPDVRYSQGENPMAIARYTLAVDRRFKRDGEQSADFINCSAFGRSAEFAESKAAASQNNNRGASQPSTPQPSTAASDGFMNIPDGLEDELPFN